MRNLFAPNCVIIYSSILIIFGLFFLLIFPSIFQYFAYKEFSLSPTSQSFKHWRKTPLPVTLDIYLFNWTNPKQFGKETPTFTEQGPYRFYEVREKVNLTWNANGTVSYRQSRSWHFRESESEGSLDDVITTINPVTLTAAYKLRHSSSRVANTGINAFFMFMAPEAWLTSSIREILFDGYEDSLMTIAHSLPQAINPASSPFDKFAWFYKRNSSYSFDGWFNVDTGAEDISRLGRLHQWNWRERTGFYPGRCGNVEGYTGDMFPPGVVRKDSSLRIFSQDLCRAVHFDYGEEADVHGVKGLKFYASLRDLDLPSPLDPPAEHCCGKDCVGGFFNLTKCRYGAPVFVSFPHFYDAYPTFLNKVHGLRPNPEKHRFHFTIEPTYGIPIDVGARVQLNMFVQPISKISMYEKAPRLMFPVLWADQRVRITEPLAAELRMVILLPTLATVLGVLMLSAGTALLIFNMVLRAKRRRNEKHTDTPM